MRNSGSNGRKDRGQIRIDDLVPQPVRDGLDRTLGIPFAGHRQKSWSGVDARIGEHDIEPAVSFDGFVDSSPDCIAIRNIDGNAGYIAARLELGHGLIEARLVFVQQDDACIIVEHCLGEGPTQAFGTAGNNDRKAGDVEQILDFHVEVPCLSDQRRMGSLPSQFCAAAK
jgi:hypothetical protein